MKFLDSHFHIWPESHLYSLVWQSASHPFHRQYSIDEYILATKPNSPTDDHCGFIFVEADREFSLNPPNWTEPINEFKYALSIRHGQNINGVSSQGATLRGLIAWAPLPFGAQGMQTYCWTVRSVAFRSGNKKPVETLSIFNPEQASGHLCARSIRDLPPLWRQYPHLQN